MVKVLPLKKRLARELRRAWPVPTWVIARTRRDVRFSNRRRSWRRSRIKP
ncbi:MAG: 50S ribosomal protein L39e [Nitrososphaerota archaeon]